MLVWCVDDAQFEGQQEQDFEDADQQQHFEEGKWPLDHTFIPKNSQFIHIYFIDACVYNMIGN